MRQGKICFKGEGCICQTENNRKRSGGKEAEPEPDFVKKETKKAVPDSRILRTNIRHRKTENPRKIQGISLPVLYCIQFKKIRFFPGMRWIIYNFRLALQRGICDNMMRKH